MLLYHRIAQPERDLLNLCVSPAHFAEHMEALRGRPVMHFDDLVRGVRDGSAPQGAIAITFDDGYIDNLEAARPVLEREGLPATLFVATSFIGGGREYWWDELERLHFESGGWGAKAYMGAIARIRRLAPARIQDELRVMRERAGEPPEGAHRADRRPMTVDELVRHADGELVRAGAHTRDHPLLRLRGEDEQREELAGSRADLEDWLGRPVTTAAYPFGEPFNDWDRATLRAAGDAGLEFAAAVSPRLVTRRSPALAIPRALPPDEGGDSFERWLAGFLP